MYNADGQSNLSLPSMPIAPSPKEFTFRATLLGIVLGIVFGVGNTYLGLKVGMTVSASIPAAVLSMALLRFFGRNVSILENNIVQTIAAVGEGLAAGVIFTIPALFFLGVIPSIFKICFLSILGGILGILFMIPMRRYIIVKEHGILPFPEGTACAEILKTRESGNSGALLALWGILIGAIHKLASSALFLWNESINFIIRPYENSAFSMDCTPSLLGVGYIIGPRISAVMLSGGALGWWVIIPLIKMFGTGMTPIYPSLVPINVMDADAIWSSYVRYIGAGAVAIGGIFGLVKIFPIIHKTITVGFKELFQGLRINPNTERTDRDISLSWLLVGSVAIILILWIVPTFSMNFLTIVLLAILAFFFSAVTSITVGLVGSSSNPLSGMTITTLLIVCIIFTLIGWTEKIYLISAITMGCVASIAIALASTTSQDLKTGFLLGATPQKQQIAELIGLVIPSFAIAGTLLLLNEAHGLGSAQLPAPQATLMALIAKGVMTGQLPIVLVIIGMILGIVMHLVHVPILPFAIGLYLPLSLSTAVMVGGIVAWIIRKWPRSEEDSGRGVLIASGLVAGDACMGVVIALLTVLGTIPDSKLPFFSDAISLIIFILVSALIILMTRSKKTAS